MSAAPEPVTYTYLEFLRRFMPKEYERRKSEGCCMHCGAKKPPSLLPLSRGVRENR